MPESPFSISNNEISNKLDLTRPLRPSENLIGANDKLNELNNDERRPKPGLSINDKLTSQTTRAPDSRVKTSGKTKPTIRTTTTTTTTTTVKPLIDNKLDFSTTAKRLKSTRQQKIRTTTIRTKTKASKRTKRKVRRTKRKTTRTTTKPSTSTTVQNRRHDGWIVINEDDGQRQTTTTTTRKPQGITNRRTTVRGWVLLENRRINTNHVIVKRDTRTSDVTDGKAETGRDLEQPTKDGSKISDLIDFDLFEKRSERDLKTTTDKTTEILNKMPSRIFPVRYNMFNKRVTTKDKTKNTLVDDKLDRLKSSIDHRLDWTRNTKHPNWLQGAGFLNQDNATAYLRNHAVNLDDMHPKYRTNEYYYLDDTEEFDNYRPVPIQIPQRQQYTGHGKKQRPIGFRNNMPIYDLTQTKIDTQQYEHNFVHTVTSTLRPGSSISYEVEIPLMSTKPTRIRIRPSNRPNSDSYGSYRPYGQQQQQQQKYKTTTSKPELQTFYSVDTEEDERPFYHETYSYRPPLQTTPRPISFVSSTARPVSVTMDPLSFFMASTTSLSSLYLDTPDTDYTNAPPHTVKVQSTFAAILGNNYPTITDSLLSEPDDTDPDTLHVPPHLIPEVDEKYFFNDQNWEKVDNNKRHDTGHLRKPAPQQTYTSSYIDYSQYNTNTQDRDTKTKYYYVDNVLHKKDAFGDIYRKKEGRRYAETFADKDNETHWIRVTRQVHMNDLDNTDDQKRKDGITDKLEKTLKPNKRIQGDTAFVSLVVLNSAER